MFNAVLDYRPRSMRQTRTASRFSKRELFSGLAVICGAFMTSAHARAETPTLTVRADTRFTEVAVTERDEAVRLSGQLVDDGGEPVAGVDVSLRVTPSEGEWAPCPDWVGQPGAAARVQTDSQGRFCIQSDSISESAKLSAEFKGDRYHRGAAEVAPLARTKRTIVLELDATMLEIPLDQPVYALRISARATDGAAFGERVGVDVAQKSANGILVTIGQTEVPIGGRSRVELDTARLGVPGPGELVIRQVERPGSPAADEVVPIRKTATVVLSSPKSSEATDPTSGFVLPVGVTSVRGAVPDGWVEASIEDRPVGMGSVQAGVADVRVRFDAPRADSISVALRYVGHDPWWLPGEPLVVSIPVRPPSAWKRIPWLLAVVTITFWVVRAWHRPGRARRIAERPSTQPTGRPEIRVVEPKATGSGWSGTVRDAHDGTPIPEATLEIVNPTFEGEVICARVHTNVSGNFELSPATFEQSDGTRLRVTATDHTELVRHVPPPGRLTISIVTRRRALLQRLVDWAKARGRPWVSAGDPTPGQVAKIAAARTDRTAEMWARGVESAAFGQTTPDEQVERSLIETEPRAPNASNDR